MSRKDSTSVDRVWDIIEKVGIAMLTTYTNPPIG